MDQLEQMDQHEAGDLRVGQCGNSNQHTPMCQVPKSQKVTYKEIVKGTKTHVMKIFPKSSQMATSKKVHIFDGTSVPGVPSDSFKTYKQQLGMSLTMYTQIFPNKTQGKKETETPATFIADSGSTEVKCSIYNDMKTMSECAKNYIKNQLNHWLTQLRHKTPDFSEKELLNIILSKEGELPIFRGVALPTHAMNIFPNWVKTLVSEYNKDMNILTSPSNILVDPSKAAKVQYTKSVTASRSKKIVKMSHIKSSTKSKVISPSKSSATIQVLNTPDSKASPKPSPTKHMDYVVSTKTVVAGEAFVVIIPKSQLPATIEEMTRPNGEKKKLACYDSGLPTPTRLSEGDVEKYRVMADRVFLVQMKDERRKRQTEKNFLMLCSKLDNGELKCKFVEPLDKTPEELFHNKDEIYTKQKVPKEDKSKRKKFKKMDTAGFRVTPSGHKKKQPKERKKLPGVLKSEKMKSKKASSVGKKKVTSVARSKSKYSSTLKYSSATETRHKTFSSISTFVPKTKSNLDHLKDALAALQDINPTLTKKELIKAVVGLIQSSLIMQISNASDVDDGVTRSTVAIHEIPNFLDVKTSRSLEVFASTSRPNIISQSLYTVQFQDESHYRKPEVENKETFHSDANTPSFDIKKIAEKLEIPKTKCINASEKIPGLHIPLCKHQKHHSHHHHHKPESNVNMHHLKNSLHAKRQKYLHKNKTPKVSIEKPVHKIEEKNRHKEIEIKHEDSNANDMFSQTIDFVLPSKEDLLHTLSKKRKNYLNQNEPAQESSQSASKPALEEVPWIALDLNGEWLTPNIEDDGIDPEDLNVNILSGQDEELKDDLPDYLQTTKGAGHSTKYLHRVPSVRQSSEDVEETIQQEDMQESSSTTVWGLSTPALNRLPDSVQIHGEPNSLSDYISGKFAYF